MTTYYTYCVAIVHVYSNFIAAVNSYMNFVTCIDKDSPVSSLNVTMKSLVFLIRASTVEPVLVTTFAVHLLATDCIMTTNVITLPYKIVYLDSK